MHYSHVISQLAYQGQERSYGGLRRGHELFEGYAPVVGEAGDVLLHDGDGGSVLALEQQLVSAELNHRDGTGEGVSEEVPLLGGALVQARRHVGEDGLDPFVYWR